MCQILVISATQICLIVLQFLLLPSTSIKVESLCKVCIGNAVEMVQKCTYDIDFKAPLKRCVMYLIIQQDKIAALRTAKKLPVQI